MDDIPIGEAKSNLEGLVERAVRGEDIRIVHGGAVVQITPVTPKPPASARRLGSLEGVFLPPADLFDSLPPDELKRWWGVR